MLPTLAPISAKEASRRASVPDFCILRTRTVRMSLRSHAIACSFRACHSEGAFDATEESHVLSKRSFAHLRLHAGAGASVAQDDTSIEYLHYITLRMEFNSSKDLILAQSGSGKMPIGSQRTGFSPTRREPTT